MMTDIPQIVSKVISKKPDAETFSDPGATTLDWAATNKGSATVIAETGFWRGGRNTWLYATHNANLKAAVAWYGPIKCATSEIQPRSSSRCRRPVEVPATRSAVKDGRRLPATRRAYVDGPRWATPLSALSAFLCKDMRFDA